MQDHWLANTEDSSEQWPAVHIHEIQAVEVRRVGRIDMEGKVVGHFVVVSVGPCDLEDRIDVSWLVAPATGN